MNGSSQIQPNDDPIDSLLGKMTLEEKIGQLNLVTPGGAVTGSVVSQDVEQKIRDGQVGGLFGKRGAKNLHQIQKLAVEESRLGIPLLFGLDVIHGHRTIFPIPLAMSCSWDMELIKNVARVASREATAEGIMWNFSPMVDIARDPRWGRIAEGSGEDPFLGAAIATAMVEGYQGEDLKDSTTLAACVKHFAVYGAAEGGRDYGSTDMSNLKMYNEYLPPYKAAVDVGVKSVMTSFNAHNYIPASANQFLFQEVLREHWGFTGMVVTDYTSVKEMIEHGLGDLKEVSAKAINADIDMEMVGEGFLNTLKKSVKDGMVSEQTIDRACRRVLELKQALGLFENPYLYGDETRAKQEIMSIENRTFARKVAAQSFVLLKNNNNILPLSKSGNYAVIGPLADSRRNMLGTWSVSGDHSKAVTVLEGIREVVGDLAQLSYAKGANISDDPVFAKRVNAFGPEIVIDDRSSQSMIDEALKIANSADVIIAVMGEAADMSGEASSMAYIGLQSSQSKLLKALNASGKPIVLVLYNGRPMTLNWEHENMDAILDVWFGGTEGGNAVAEVLFGDENPGGKLTTSFPVHVGQIPVYHSMLNTGRPDYVGGEKFKSNYLDIPNEPLYPFGYGLSYSDFEYGEMQLSADSIQKHEEISASISITNTSKIDGDEIVQLYIRDKVASISRPVKELKGFQKVHIQAGETKVVTFSISEDLLSFYNHQYKQIIEPGQFDVMIGPNSREVFKKTFTLLD